MTSIDDYRWLFRKAPMMATSICDDGLYHDVSDAFVDRMGHAREQMIGRRPSDFITAESAERIETTFLPLLRRDGRLEGERITFVTLSGESVDCLTNAVVEQPAVIVNGRHGWK